MQEHFPHLVNDFRNQIRSYRDRTMTFRRQMLRNLYYLRSLPEEIINELICNLVSKRYAAGSVIMKSGDVATHLNFLRMGEIDIMVSSGINHHFENMKKKEDEKNNQFFNGYEKAKLGVQKNDEFD